MAAADIAVPRIACAVSVAAAMVSPAITHGHMAAAGEVPGSSKMCAAAEMPTGGMAPTKGVTAAGEIPTSGMAPTKGVTAAARVAATAAGMALRQCRSRASQDEAQRANRQKNAFALDAHLLLLTQRPRAVAF